MHKLIEITRKLGSADAPFLLLLPPIVFFSSSLADSLQWFFSRKGSEEVECLIKEDNNGYPNKGKEPIR